MIFGAVIDENLKDEVRVTVIATGFGAQRRRRGRSGLDGRGRHRRRRPGTRSPEFDPGDSLEVPSFLRDD